MSSAPAEQSAAQPGQAIVTASWVGTAVFVVAALAGTIELDWAVVTVVVSMVLFLGGMVAFAAAYLRAVGRSRYEAIGMGGLFFLAGSAPRAVQRSMMASFVVEIVVGFVTAWIRIYTPVVFGLLVPMFGLGMMGLWGSRYGTFGPRVEDGAPRSQRPAADDDGG